MKKLIVLFIICAFLGGCATTAKVACPACPSSKVLLKLRCGGMVQVVPMPKGFLDNPDNFRTEEQFREEIREMMEKRMKGDGI